MNFLLIFLTFCFNTKYVKSNSSLINLHYNFLYIGPSDPFSNTPTYQTLIIILFDVSKEISRVPIAFVAF
jgi:hypothetical protein